MAQWTYAWDSKGLLSSLRANDSRVVWSFDRDAQGRLVRAADNEYSGPPTGRETLFTWRSDGQPDTITYHGVTTTQAYDPATSNLSTSSSLVATTVNLGYDAAGNVSWVNDGIRMLGYGYDNANRLTSITDAEANVTELGYLDTACGCSFGDRVTRGHTPDLPADLEWSLGYDSEGRLASLTDPLGASESFEYSSMGDLDRATDRFGRTVLYKRLADPLQLPDQRLGRGLVRHVDRLDPREGTNRSVWFQIWIPVDRPRSLRS